MKKTKKVLICMGIAASMLCPALGATAATVTQPELTIYQGTLPVPELSSLTAGSGAILKKQLVNNTNQDQRMALIAAEYDNKGRLIQAQTSDVTVAANSVEYASVEITPTYPANIKVFTWELPDVTPKDASSYNTLSSVKIGSYSTYVEDATKTVYVNTEADISSAEVTDVKVSANASYAVAADNSTITVTAEDGTAQVYTVKAGNFIKLDFEADTIDAAPTTGTISPTGSATRKVTVVADPDDASNKVLKVWDNYSNTSSASCSYTYILEDSVAYPYVVSAKVRYDRDNAFSSGVEDMSYSWFRLRNRNTDTSTNTEIYHFGAAETGDGDYHLTMPHEAGNSGVSTVATAQGGIGQWHQVDMVCNSADDIKIYYDGRLVRNAAAENSGVDLNRIVLVTTDARKNTTYLDDIVVRPIEKGSLSEAVFNVPSLMVDGKIYVQATDISAVTIDESASTYSGTGISVDTASSAVVVTGEGGATSYPVVLKAETAFFADDYASDAWTGEKQDAAYVGSGATDDDKVYYNRQNRNTAGDEVYMMTVSENGNKVLKMNAGAGTASNNRFGLNITNIPSSSNYVIAYDVKYSIPEGLTFNNSNTSGEGVTPVGFQIQGRKGSTTLVGFRPVNYSTDTETFKAGIYYNTSTAETTGTIAMNKWYKVKIVVQDGQAIYYLDNKQIDSRSVAKEALTTIAIWSTDNRKALVYLDNLKVLDLTENNAQN